MNIIITILLLITMTLGTRIGVSPLWPLTQTRVKQLATIMLMGIGLITIIQFFNHASTLNDISNVICFLILGYIIKHISDDDEPPFTLDFK